MRRSVKIKIPKEIITPEKFIEGIQNEWKDRGKLPWLRRDRYETHDKGKWQFIVTNKQSTPYGECLNETIDVDLDKALEVVEMQLCSNMFYEMQQATIIVNIRRKEDEER